MSARKTGDRPGQRGGSSDKDPRNATLIKLLRNMFQRQETNRRHAAAAARTARKLAANKAKRGRS